jgi:hypothetical protein
VLTVADRLAAQPLGKLPMILAKRSAKTIHLAISALFAFPFFSGTAFAHHRIAPQQNPAAIAAQQSPAVQIQFAFSGDVAQVPAQVADSLVLVPVRVNGSQPSWFVLDTERATSAIDDVRAAAVGLYSPSSGAGRPKSFADVSLEFPGLKISLPTLALDSFEDLSARIGHSVQGVLGADVLNHFILKINYQAQSVQFYDAKSFQYSGRGAQIPLQISAGIPAITGKVTVRHRGRFNGLLAIATAQTEPVAFSPQFARSHDFSDLPERMLPFPGADAASDTDVREFLGRVQALQFGKIDFADPIAIFPTKSDKGAGTGPSQFVCAIGGEILSRFAVILNYPAKLLILEPNRSFPDNFTADMSGLTFIAIPPALNRFEVAQVAAKSPAAAAKVEVGDMLEKVDGNPASDYSLDDLRALLRQWGTSHALSLLRNGKPIEVTLQLKRLL